MPKNGFQIMDSDLHVFEPADMYQQYLEPEFRHRAPTYIREFKAGANTWMVDGKPYPPKFPSARSKRRYAGLQVKKTQSPEHLEAAARGFDAIATLCAMDDEDTPQQAAGNLTPRD